MRDHSVRGLALSVVVLTSCASGGVSTRSASESATSTGPAAPVATGEVVVEKLDMGGTPTFTAPSQPGDFLLGIDLSGSARTVSYVALVRVVGTAVGRRKYRNDVSGECRASAGLTVT
jgi:hypothetical protein